MALSAARLAQAGVELPELSGPYGAYVPAKRVGDLLFVAGQLPRKEGKLLAIGQVPSRCAPPEARVAARQCVVNALAAAASAVELERIVGVARVDVFVSSDATFFAQAQIADGASELLLELFGADAGSHVRAAVGVSALPHDAAVEIAFLFVVR